MAVGYCFNCDIFLPSIDGCLEHVYVEVCVKQINCLWFMFMVYVEQINCVPSEEGLPV